MCYDGFIKDLRRGYIMEVWKPVVGFEEYYEVSNLGRVRSLPRKVRCKVGYRSVRGTILRSTINNSGYNIVKLSVNQKQKTMLVHRLVAMSFIPNEYNKPQVNHINEDKQDNRVDNLEWATQVENINHGTAKHRGALKQSIPVRAVSLDGKIELSFVSSAEAGRNGFNQRHVSECCRGVLKTHGGFRWSFDTKEEE